MGYVLPVNHDQYYNYQKRAIRDNQDLFHIEKPARIILKQINRQNWRRHSNIYKKDQNGGLQLKRPNLPENADLYAQLTGKGRDFNQSV